MADIQNYDEGLDYCEVSFDNMLKGRRRDAERLVLRHDKRFCALEIDDSTGEVSEELQKHSDFVQTSGLRDIEQNALLIDVDGAIDQLPDLQRQILHLARRGYPMYSEDQQTPCISKILKKSDKTVRTHFQQAITTIQSILKGEKIP